MWAAWYGREEAVRASVRNGADLNLKSAAGKTALSLAEAGNHTDVAQLLQDAGARDEEPPETEKSPHQEYSS